MDEIVSVFLSWQFLLIGIIVYFLFGLFNNFIGPSLWKVYKLRKVLKVAEGFKMIWPPIFGFVLGLFPSMPRPEPLQESEQVTVAMLFCVAGLCCQWIVKGIKKALEARGIDVELDLDPRAQKRAKFIKR